MKKLVLMIVVLMVSAITMSTWAQTSQMHRFLKPQYHNKLSDAEYRTALKMLFSNQSPEKYWNSIPTCNYNQMRSMYAQHLMKVYNLPELPTSEAMVALVDISNTVTVPNTVQTAGIVKGTANLEYFSRNALTNEAGLEKSGITWTIQSCGNPGNIGSLQVSAANNQQPVEEFDTPRMKTEFASHKEGSWDNNPSKSSNTITINTVSPAGTTGGGMSSEMMMMWMMSQNQQRNYQPSEVIVKNKPNAWEVIAGVTGVANLGLNLYNTFRPRIVNNYEQYYTESNNRPTWTRPDRPGRPPHQSPVTRDPWQGGSGFYPNPAYGDNSNGSGLGAGTIWGGSTPNTGGTYRLPVSNTYQW